ncbi:hypothetical protein SLA2020_428550 [Shorea laevis]
MEDLHGMVPWRSLASMTTTSCGPSMDLEAGLCGASMTVGIHGSMASVGRGGPWPRPWEVTVVGFRPNLHEHGDHGDGLGGHGPSWTWRTTSDHGHGHGGQDLHGHHVVQVF